VGAAARRRGGYSARHVRWREADRADIAACSAQFCAANPNRAAGQANAVEPPGPAKQRRIAVAPDIGKNARRHLLGSRIVRTAAGEEPGGNRVGEFQDSRQFNITPWVYFRPQSTILLSGYSTIPWAPADFKRG